MKIKMTKTSQGYPDGIALRRYVEGDVFDVPSEAMSVGLANSFLEMKVAKEVDASSPAPPAGKSAGAAPENKDAAGKKAEDKSNANEGEGEAPVSEEENEGKDKKKDGKK
jgi:hypothetical protein